MVVCSPDGGRRLGRRNGTSAFWTSIRMEPVARLWNSPRSSRLGAVYAELLLERASARHQRVSAIRRQRRTDRGSLRAAFCFHGRTLLVGAWSLRAGRANAIALAADVDSIPNGNIPSDHHCSALGPALRLSGIFEEFQRRSLS